MTDVAWVNGASRQVLRLLALGLVVLGCSGFASRVDENVAIPATDEPGQVSTHTVDRSSPTQIAIWDEKRIGYSGINSWSYVGNCLSETDTSIGACPVHESAGMPTKIRLQFVEKRTGLIIELSADATRREISDPYSVNLVSGLTDFQRANRALTQINATVVLPPSEVAKFPTGGIWEAKLFVRMNFGRSTDPSQGVNPDVTWDTTITLHVTDENNIQVYLPEFGLAPPLVDLDLRARPMPGGPGAELIGHHVIDACLYDGYNANSESISIQVDDISSSVSDGAFRVRLENAGSAPKASEEIIYQITAPDPSTGELMSFRAGREETFAGGNTSHWRVVRLPFGPMPVICTPWPITLDSHVADSLLQAAGRYTGTFRVTFKVSPVSP